MTEMSNTAAAADIIVPLEQQNMFSYCCGICAYIDPTGECHIYTNMNTSTPTKINIMDENPCFATAKPVSVKCGVDFVLMLSETGILHCWAENKLCVMLSITENIPPIKSIYCENSAVWVITMDDSLILFGWFSQYVGDNVENLLLLTDVKDFQWGDTYYLVLHTNGTVTLKTSCTFIESGSRTAFDASNIKDAVQISGTTNVFGILFSDETCQCWMDDQDSPTQLNLSIGIKFIESLSGIKQLLFHSCDYENVENYTLYVLMHSGESYKLFSRGNLYHMEEFMEDFEFMYPWGDEKTVGVKFDGSISFMCKSLAFTKNFQVMIAPKVVLM